jgi:hypothetical protein
MLRNVKRKKSRRKETRGLYPKSAPDSSARAVQHVCSPHSASGLLSAHSRPGFLPGHRDVLQITQIRLVRDEGCAN